MEGRQVEPVNDDDMDDFEATVERVEDESLGTESNLWCQDVQYIIAGQENVNSEPNEGGTIFGDTFDEHENNDDNTTMGDIVVAMIEKISEDSSDDPPTNATDDDYVEDSNDSYHSSFSALVPLENDLPDETNFHKCIIIAYHIC